MTKSVQKVGLEVLNPRVELICTARRQMALDDYLSAQLLAQRKVGLCHGYVSQTEDTWPSASHPEEHWTGGQGWSFGVMTGSKDGTTTMALRQDQKVGGE